MLIDMHMHEMTYSKDSHLTLPEMVKTAKELGLDALCITDHDSMGLRDYAQAYAREAQFPIFIGMEYYSLQGDIIAFGIDDYPRTRVSAQQFINRVKAQGGVCFSAHPFRKNRRGLEETLKTVTGLDGAEILNGSTLPKANQKAADYARDLHLALLGGSDCHIHEKIGVYVTYFPSTIYTTRDLLAAIRKGSCVPAYLKNGTYRLWNPYEKNFWEEGVTPQEVVEYSQLHPVSTDTNV